MTKILYMDDLGEIKKFHHLPTNLGRQLKNFKHETSSSGIYFQYMNIRILPQSSDYFGSSTLYVHIYYIQH